MSGGGGAAGAAARVERCGAAAAVGSACRVSAARGRTGRPSRRLAALCRPKATAPGRGSVVRSRPPSGCRQRPNRPPASQPPPATVLTSVPPPAASTSCIPLFLVVCVQAAAGVRTAGGVVDAVLQGYVSDGVITREEATSMSADQLEFLIRKRTRNSPAPPPAARAAPAAPSAGAGLVRVGVGHAAGARPAHVCGQPIAAAAPAMRAQHMHACFPPCLPQREVAAGLGPCMFPPRLRPLRSALMLRLCLLCPPPACRPASSRTSPTAPSPPTRPPA